MTPGRTQVLISGGGPAGLSAAVELSGRGIECVVVEPRPEPTRLRPRAKTLNMRTLEHLRRWGLEEELRSRAPLPTSWSQDISFVTTLLGTEINRFTGVLGLADPDGVSPVLGQQMPQYVLEDMLREVVAQTPQCTMLIGARVTGLTQDDSGVSVQVEDSDGRRGEIAADFVLGADGARSAVREAIGAEYVGTRALQPNVGVVFRSPELAARLETRPAVQSWLINDRVPGMMGPVDREGTWWLIAFGVDGTAPDLDPVALVQGALGEPWPVEIVSTDPWTARMELADKCRVGRAFLIGDAAHLNPPFGGHGLNTGIGDAVDLGWKLAAVLNGWGGPGLLDSYEAERRSLQQRVIDEAAANMSVLSTQLVRAELDELSPEGDAARSLLSKEIDATKRREYFSLHLVLGHRYADSPVIPVESGPAGPEDEWATKARAGRRLPHAWLADGTSTLDVVGPDYTVLVLGDAAVGGLETAAAAAGLPLRVERHPSPALAARLGAELVIVRPDQVVAWCSDDVPADPTALVEVLAGTKPRVR